MNIPYQSLVITEQDRKRYEALGLAKWPNPALVAHEERVARCRANSERLHRYYEAQKARRLQLGESSDGGFTPREQR